MNFHSHTVVFHGASMAPPPCPPLADSPQSQTACSWGPDSALFVRRPSSHSSSCEDSKAHVVAARPVVPIPIRRPQVRRVVVPTPAVNHAVRASGQSPHSSIARSRKPLDAPQRTKANIGSMCRASSSSSHSPRSKCHTQRRTLRQKRSRVRRASRTPRRNTRQPREVMPPPRFVRHRSRGKGAKGVRLGMHEDCSAQAASAPRRASSRSAREALRAPR